MHRTHFGLGLLLSGATALFAPRLAAAAPCGLLDDGHVYLPGNYHDGTNFTTELPALGSTITDDAFGCPITRLSNGPAERNAAIYHEYAPINAVNADDSKVLAVTGDGWWMVKDLTGRVVAAANLPGSSVPATGSNPAAPRWSQTPNAFYTVVGTSLYSVDVSQGTFAYRLLDTFSDYTSLAFPDHSDIGADGDHLGLQGTKTDGSTKAFAYQVSTKTRSPEVAMTLSDHGDEIEITPNDQVLVSRSNAAVEVRRMSDMALLRTLPVLGGWHHGIGRDVDGSDVFMLPASPDSSTSCAQNGIEKVSIDTAVKSCVYPFSWWSDASHVSVTNNGWVVWSNTDWIVPNLRPESTAQIQLPGDWQSIWQPGMNEVVLMRTDGTQVHHLVHHRSRPLGTGTDDLGGGSYWDEPRATVSRDGSIVLFDSNWGVPDASTSPPTAAYADVYMIATGLAGASNGGPVNWTNLLGAAASGGSITKTSTACDGCDDSGGASGQQIASGGATLQFDAGGGTTTFRMVGLSRPGTTVHYPTLDFAILLAGNGKAQVWEDGTVRVTVNSYAASDVFKIVVASDGSAVRYYQNQTLLYTNPSPTLVYPLGAYASLWSLGSAIDDAQLSSP
ncbi:MAG TPA: hypothetical protein VGI39_23935 [Polyangiaceae bacterium]|jgi:hypothetical protein